MKTRTRNASKWLACLAVPILVLTLVQTCRAVEPPVWTETYRGERTCSHCHGEADWTMLHQTDIWSASDPHSKAFTVLTNDLSKQMAKWMGLPADRPAEWRKCTRCHTPSVPENLRGTAYKIEEGISCEACHGAAGDWFYPHLEWDATHDRNVQLGLVDLREPVVRARTCLRCHSGLDHEIVAGGHPDLSFELFHFSLWQPPHWDYKELSPFTFWAAGQAVGVEYALADLSTALTDPASGRDLHVKAFEDKACYQCHHKLETDRGRLLEGNWNAYRPLLANLFPEESKPFIEKTEALFPALASGDPTQQEAILSQARQLAAEAKDWTAKVGAFCVTTQPQPDLLKKIVRDLISPLPESKSEWPSPVLPSAWAIPSFNRGEQNYYALKTLGLALAVGEEGKTTGELLAAMTAGTLKSPFLDEVDSLWPLIGAVYPAERKGVFSVEKFNLILKEVATKEP